MRKDLMLKGMILGMEKVGARFVKTDGFYFYFYIKIGSTIDNKDALGRAKDAFMQTFGMGLKVCRVDELK